MVLLLLLRKACSNSHTQQLCLTAAPASASRSLALAKQRVQGQLASGGFLIRVTGSFPSKASDPAISSSHVHQISCYLLISSRFMSVGGASVAPVRFSFGEPERAYTHRHPREGCGVLSRVQVYFFSFFRQLSIERKHSSETVTNQQQRNKRSSGGITPLVARIRTKSS